MQMSSLFARTLRETNAPDAATRLFIRGGFARPGEAGLSLLPLGVRVFERIQTTLLRRMPEYQPVSLRLDRRGQAWSALLRPEIQSHRQLPIRLWSAGTLHSRQGGKGIADPAISRALQLAIAAEDPQLLASAFHPLAVELEGWFQGWRVVEVGDRQKMWMIKEAGGPAAWLECGACGCAALAEAAAFRRPPSSMALERSQPELVETPGADTIRALVEMLEIEPQQTLKALFLHDERGEVFVALLGGDRELSLSKLSALTGGRRFEPATAAEILAVGAQPGYGSPWQLKIAPTLQTEGLKVIGDLQLEQGGFYVCGANRPDYHLRGVSYPRDISATQIADIAAARPGDHCAHCGEALDATSGIQIASELQLGDAFSYSEAGGQLVPGNMSLLTILLEPLAAAIINANHDEHGICWPPGFAPFDVHLVDLKTEGEALDLAARLEAAGISVLLDDRPLSPGVKFATADLIGCPLRLTIGRRSLEQGGVELKARRQSETQLIALETLISHLQQVINS